MARFRNFYSLQKVKTEGDFIKKGAMLFEKVQRFILAKKYFGVRCTLSINYVNGLHNRSELTLCLISFLKITSIMFTMPSLLLVVLIKFRESSLLDSKNTRALITSFFRILYAYVTEREQYICNIAK